MYPIYACGVRNSVPILAAAQPKFKSTCPNDELRFYVAMTGSDGYASILSYAEIDPNLGIRNPLDSLTENGSSLVPPAPGSSKTATSEAGTRYPARWRSPCSESHRESLSRVASRLS